MADARFFNFVKEYITKSKLDDRWSIYKYTEVDVLRYHPLNYELFEKRSSFFPDMTIYADGYAFDIEIDEPYSFDSNSPIHYSSPSLTNIDEQRNGFFTHENWCVIRFAEQQIYEDPIGCFDFIHSVVTAVSTSDIELLQLSRIDPYNTQIFCNSPRPIKKWSKKDAENMAIFKIRERYLSNSPLLQFSDVVPNDEPMSGMGDCKFCKVEISPEIAALFA